MTSDPGRDAQIHGEMVLVPAVDIVEVPVADEVILWQRDRAVPLQLNSVATTIWWHFETASLNEIANDVAHHYRQPVERVLPGLYFVTESLHTAGLLHTGTNQVTQAPASPPTVIEHPPNAQIGRMATAWLHRRSVYRASALVGKVRFDVASNTPKLDEAARSLLSSSLDDATPAPAPIRYCLIDAGTTGSGWRYWLLSDTGLPLGRAHTLDDLTQLLADHVAELVVVQQTANIPLRLGVLEARNHVVAVQWDLLASRPVLEPALDRLGYQIRSGQWAVVDRSDLGVRLSGTTIESAQEPDVAGLPVGGIVGWFGSGSLAAPHTHAEWAWALAMFGCASSDLDSIDRQGLLETAVALAQTGNVFALSDAGPSALLQTLTVISERWVG